jgi:pyroglutamyl-peptidase
MRTLITSFGPFSDYDINPSNRVMEVLRARIEKDRMPDQVYSFEKLDVSWERVDHFIRTCSYVKFDLFIHLGVATGSNKIRIETKGRNIAVGKDINANEPSFNYILNHASDINSILPMSALHEFATKHPNVVLSDNAGNYLCNYLYFKSLYANGQQSKVLFIHIADSMNEQSAPGIERQAELVYQLINILHNQ